MHELSLAKNVCDIVADHLGPTQRVVAVTVEYGPLCGVVPEALSYCFSVVAKSYGFEGARLELASLGADATCPACGAACRVHTAWAPCPACGHLPVTVEGGFDLRIKELEVDEATHV